MEQHKNSPVPLSEVCESEDRREIVRKLGKFAAYAAPFTVLAMNAKAASGSGPAPHAARPAAGH